MIGNPYEYISTIPLPHYDVLDGDNPLVKALGKDGAAKLMAKLNHCVDSQSTYISTRVEALSARPQNPAPIWISARYRTAPGKATDYENFLKSDVFPVYAKAKTAGKIAGYSLSRRGVGSNTRDRVTIIYANKIAEIEGGNPLTQMLGAEGAAKIAAKGADYASMVEVVARRRVPELSY